MHAYICARTYINVWTIRRQRTSNVRRIARIYTRRNTEEEKRGRENRLDTRLCECIHVRHGQARSKIMRAMRKGRGKCERGSSQPSLSSREEDRARNLDKADKDADDGLRRVRREQRRSQV